MENDFRIKKNNATEINAIKTQLVVTCKKFKTEQNWADITSDRDNDEDELEIL